MTHSLWSSTHQPRAETCETDRLGRAWGCGDEPAQTMTDRRGQQSK